MEILETMVIPYFRHLCFHHSLLENPKLYLTAHSDKQRGCMITQDALRKTSEIGAHYEIQPWNF